MMWEAQDEEKMAKHMVGKLYSRLTKSHMGVGEDLECEGHSKEDRKLGIGCMRCIQ